MDTPPRQNPSSNEEDIRAARRMQDIVSMSTTYMPTVPSWGERLLPYLFAAMETCWVDAILVGLASLGFPESRQPLIPLWTPFVLIAGATWLATYQERHVPAPDVALDEHTLMLTRGSLVGIVLFVVLVLVSIWASLYASMTFLWNPVWLGMLISDVLSLNGNAFRIFATTLLSIYFCWRGFRLARFDVEPSSAFNMLRVGLGVMLAVIVIRGMAGVGFFDEPVLLLLIPLFLACALVAHAFALVTFLRRSHPAGLQGSTAAQERALLAIIGAIGVLLFLVTLLVGTFASPAFLAGLQNILSPVSLLYDLVVRVIAYIILLLVTPIFLLFQFFHIKTQAPKLTFPQNPLRSKFTPQSTPPSVLATVVVLLVNILLPLLLIVLVYLLVRFLLRRRRIVLIRRSEDLHESLWSRKLFWTQLKSFLRALWLRLFPARAVEQQVQRVEGEMSGEASARSVREIYRALLKWAAARGYPRKRDETPYEFQARLDERLPQIEPQLGTLTDTYTATRYGQAVPDEEEVAQVRRLWTDLQQKSQTP